MQTLGPRRRLQYHAGPMKRLLILLALAASTAVAQTPSDSLVLVHAGRLLDRPGQAPRGASTVVIRDGQIEAVRDGFATPTAFPAQPSSICASATCCRD